MVSKKTLYMHLYIDGRNPFTQWLMEYQIYMHYTFIQEMLGLVITKLCDEIIAGPFRTRG